MTQSSAAHDTLLIKRETNRPITDRMAKIENEMHTPRAVGSTIILTSAGSDE